MRCCCKYDPIKDIAKVNPVGWLDLKEAYKHGVIPGDIDFDENDSNGIDDPSNVGESPRDPFQAKRLLSSAQKVAESRAQKSASPGNDEPGDK